MKTRERLSIVLDRSSKILPNVTGWLWVLGVIGAAICGLLWAESGDEGSIVPFVALVVASALALLARLRGWRSKEWFSMITWVCALTAANLLLLEHGPGAFGATRPYYGLFIGGPGYPESVWESASDFALSLLNLRWLVIVSAFALVYELHRRRLVVSDSSSRLAIGGRWKVIPALVVGVIVAGLFEMFPPFGTVTVALSSEGFLDSASTLVSWVDLIVGWTVGFAFYSWKTGAVLTVGERGIRIGLAETGLGLFAIPWRRVLRLRELTLRGRRESVLIEAGYLPVFRAKFSFHRTRDGADVLERVFDEAHRQGVRLDQAAVRRGTAFIGWTALASALVCTWLVQWLIEVSTGRMANAQDHDTGVFTNADYFILFGGLTACAALLLGFGLGLLFARTDGGMRAVPLIGVAVAGAMLPDPLIYWLVYIAIFSILVARVGPMEPLPAVPFPDNDVSSLGLWLVGAKALFAVSGYLLATMVAVKPWYRALPTWPYVMPWPGKRGVEVEPAANEAKFESSNA